MVHLWCGFRLNRWIVMVANKSHKYSGRRWCGSSGAAAASFISHKLNVIPIHLLVLPKLYCTLVNTLNMSSWLMIISHYYYLSFSNCVNHQQTAALYQLWPAQDPRTHSSWPRLLTFELKAKNPFVCIVVCPPPLLHTNNRAPSYRLDCVAMKAHIIMEEDQSWLQRKGDAFGPWSILSRYMTQASLSYALDSRKMPYPNC